MIMGRRTFESLPERKPLRNRLNVVVSGTLPNYDSITREGFIFAPTLERALSYVDKRQHLLSKRRTYIIGGQRLYEEAISSPRCEAVELTNVSTDRVPNVKCDTFFPRLPEHFELTDTEELEPGVVVETWENPMDPFSPELAYLAILRDILHHGERLHDRTGVGTLQEFGVTLRFPLDDPEGRIPVLTSKRVAWKSVAAEVLQFARGDINANHLSAQGVPIWNGNTSREFLDSIGGYDIETGSMWKAYGFQWRQCGLPYLGIDADYKAYRQLCTTTPPGSRKRLDALYAMQESGQHARLDPETFKRVAECEVTDQLRNVIELLRNNPTSRRIVLNAWHVPDLGRMCLPPCHMVYVFNVSRGRLNCQMLQRSWDLFLGAPFNIAGTALLVRLICHTIDGLEPGEIKIDGVNAHIYCNHTEQVAKQLNRAEDKGIYRFPTLKINKTLSSLDDWEQLTADDLELVNYRHHPGIKAPMAV